MCNAIFLVILSLFSFDILLQSGGGGRDRDIQLPMKSVPITTDVVISNLDQGEEHNIM
jgi:hypothetical protein